VQEVMRDLSTRTAEKPFGFHWRWRCSAIQWSGVGRELPSGRRDGRESAIETLRPEYMNRHGNVIGAVNRWRMP